MARQVGQSLRAALGWVAKSRAVRVIASPWSWPVDLIVAVVGNEMLSVVTGQRSLKQGYQAVTADLMGLVQNPLVHALVVVAAFVSFAIGVRRLEAAERRSERASSELAEEHQNRALGAIAESRKAMEVPVLLAKAHIFKNELTRLGHEIQAFRDQLRRHCDDSNPWLMTKVAMPARDHRNPPPSATSLRLDTVAEYHSFRVPRWDPAWDHAGAQYDIEQVDHGIKRVTFDPAKNDRWREAEKVNRRIAEKRIEDLEQILRAEQQRLAEFEREIERRVERYGLGN